MRTARPLAAVSTLVFLLAASACSSGPHRVTDTSTGKIYYTTNLEREKIEGPVYKVKRSVHFTDARTRSDVTLRTYDIKTISQSEFDAAVHGE